MDEEPPRELNREAIDVCLTASLLMGANPVDEIHVMRKLVIDGSNTTGFQRTAVVALGGQLKVDDKIIPITQISLEEDAARKGSQSQGTVGYMIDRLGVPLIEVTTSPVMQSPAEVERVAYAIGSVLRATRKVKRGLGSIRQDLNISIPGGALIEIKGVQELEVIGKAVELEVTRQQTLLSIRDELKNRGLQSNQIEREYIDLSDLFTTTKARVIRESLGRGGVVRGVRLPKFKGLLGRELSHDLRLGTEMSSRASFWGGVGGIFHSDELPAYGITAEEVAAVTGKLKLSSDDAFVVVADLDVKTRDALDAVIDRAIEALNGVPEETRNAMPDGTTRYMRPRPGAARMYPETDVPPTPVEDDYLAALNAHLPETAEKFISRLMGTYSLNTKLARQLMESDYLSVFERIVASGKIQATFVATFLTETCKSLEREGVSVHSIPDARMEAMFRLVEDGSIAKEALADLLKWQVSHANEEPETGVRTLGLTMLTEKELSPIIDRAIQKNRKLVDEKGQGAFPSIMGAVMAEVRGRADPKLVTEVVKKRLTAG
jgi:glutamyl-tRNA(Gln) amidotransferase subunit E